MNRIPPSDSSLRPALQNKQNTAKGRALESRPCSCNALYFNNATARGAVGCALCVVGSACPSAGTTLRTLTLRPAFWRPAENSTDVRRCPDASSGCARDSDTICNATTSGCVGGNELNVLCAEGLGGAFCRLCAPRDHENRSLVYYKPATQTTRPSCASCEADGVVGSYFGVVLGGVVGVLALVRLLLVAFHRAPPRVQRLVQRLWHASTPYNKLKLLLGFYIIVARVEEVYAVVLPGDVRQAFNVFVVGVNLGLSDDVGLLTCMGVRGFRNRLLFWMVAPGVLVAGTVLAVLVHQLAKHRRCSHRTLIFRSLPLITRQLFVLYPLVTNVAFRAFACYEFDYGRYSWLVADVSIACSSPFVRGAAYSAEHSEVAALGFAAIAIYAVGLLLLNGALLHSARRAILSGSETQLSRSIAFLHREFTAQMFWWELPVEMACRMQLHAAAWP